MKRPFIFITIPLIMGIISSYYLNLSITIVSLVLILALSISIINLIMGKASNMAIFLVVMGLGMLLTRVSLSKSILITKIDESLVFRGVVEEVKWSDEGQLKCIVKITDFEDGKETIHLKEKISLKIIGDKKVEIGDRISFSGKLKTPLENTNPRLFNYKLSLLSNKVYTTMTIKDYSIMDIDDNNKALKYRMKASFRRNIEGVFDNNLNKENNSLMKSIVLGEYSYLEEEDIEIYRSLGLAHILAVSGLHIGIISGFLIFLLSNLSIKRKKTVTITLSIIWFYGYLIGFPPSLLRANIMLTVIFYAQVIAEPYDSINNLFFAMFILLLINPMWIFNLGFQLSFSAAFSIVYFTPKIEEGFYPYRNKIIYGLSGLLAVQIGLLPIQAYYFNEICILGILANLIIAPILSLSLIIGGSMVGLSYLVPSLNIILGITLDLILNIQFKLVDILYNLAFGKINVHSPNLAEIILYYIFILILFGLIDIRKPKLSIKKTILYYLIIYIFISTIVVSADKTLEIHFIDVGQGDSILIRSQSGDYLVDTGGNIMDSFDVGKNITLPYLRKLGVKKLRGVFITHFDDDHSKGLSVLIDNLVIENLLVSYEDISNKSFSDSRKNSIPLIILKEKDRMFLDKNTLIQVLSPDESSITKGISSNDLSLVFLLRYYDKTILFTGDMEKEVESQLLNKIDKPIDIIKVPHHGSHTSSTEELLNELRPKIGIISVGRNNFYGHPRKEVMERYEDINTEIYRTDTMGMIKIVLDKEDLNIYPFIIERPSLGKLIDENFIIITFYIGYYLISYILTKIYIFTEEESRFNELQ